MTFFTFFAKTKSLWSQGPQHEIFENRILLGWDFRLLNISKLAECALKLFRVSQ
jgi:hypothetical protein